MADDVISIKVIAESSSVDKTNKSVDNLAATLLKTEKEALKIRKAFKLLDSAVNSGKINHQKYSKMVNELNVQETMLYKNLGKTTNAVGQQSSAMGSAAQNAKKFADAQRLAGKSTNKFGMYAQQVGYQVGDFFVQVQSGTSALVAFGQQGTQLAGLLPGVAGAVIGIGLSLGTMLLKTFLDTRDAGKQLEESVKAVEEALSDLSNVSSMLRDTLGAPFSEANTVLREYLELLEKSSAANVQKQVSLAFGAKGESTGLLNELALMAEDMQKGDLSWNLFEGLNYDATEKEIKDANELLRVREEIAEILRGTAAQPRVIEGAEGLRKLGDDLLAYSKQFNGVLGERIRNLMFESGLTKLMVDSEKARGDAATAQQADLQKNFETRQKWHKWRMRSNDKYYANAQKLTAKAREDEIKAAALVKKTHSEEKGRLTNKLSIASAEYFSLKNADEGARVEKVKANIAKRLFIESRKALNITGAKLQAEIKLYDAVQSVLGLNKDLTKEMAKQLALKNATVSKTRGNLEGLGIIEGSTESKKFYDDKRAAELRAEYEALGKGGKGKEPKTMEGPIKALERQIELSKALFGLEDHARRKEEVYMQLKFQNQDADIQASEKELRSLAERVALEEQRTKVLEEQNKVIEEQRQAQEALADSIAGSMGDAFMSIVDGTMSVKDAFKSMARAIIKELYEVLVVQQLVGSAKAGSRSGIAGGIMDFFGSANGNAMYGGNVIPFASGGVVGSPTTFPMSAGRTGLMGEAGPEAIMPLKRGANGKLGVQAEGGAGDVVIHQNFNFAANGDESVKKLIAQAAPQIANMTKSSIISDRRRGGQMKATFG